MSKDGIGFNRAHDGRNGAFVFVNFRGNENELFHRAFPCRSNDGPAVAPAALTDFLRVRMGFAWIKHVLGEGETPDFDGYFNERLNEDA